MAIKTRQELLDAIKHYIGDAITDEALTMLEDATDTLTAPEEDWETKYKELDKSWRTRYRERFESGNLPTESETNVQPLDDTSKQEPEKPKTFESLFEEVK